MIVENLINQYYKDLNENEKIIVSYILKNKKEFQDMGIVEIAEKCHTSKSSIHRLAKKLGFSGFSEFKYNMKQSEQRPLLGNDLLELQMKDIDSTLKLFKQSDAKHIVKAMKKAKRIFAYGTGCGQSAALQELSRNLIRIRNPVITIPARTEFDTLLPSINSDDFVIVISLSGNAEGFEQCIHLLNLKSVPILSVTAFRDNFLAQESMYNLYYYVTPFHKDEYSPTISFVTLVVLLDALFREYVALED